MGSVDSGFLSFYSLFKFQNQEPHENLSLKIFGDQKRDRHLQAYSPGWIDRSMFGNAIRVASDYSFEMFKPWMYSSQKFSNVMDFISQNQDQIFLKKGDLFQRLPSRFKERFSQGGRQSMGGSSFSAQQISLSLSASSSEIKDQVMDMINQINFEIEEIRLRLLKYSQRENFHSSPECKMFENMLQKVAKKQNEIKNRLANRKNKNRKKRNRAANSKIFEVSEKLKSSKASFSKLQANFNRIVVRSRIMEDKKKLALENSFINGPAEICGIPNVGNSCFLNSMIQTLAISSISKYFDPQFNPVKEEFKEKKEGQSLEKMQNRMHSIITKINNPKGEEPTREEMREVREILTEELSIIEAPLGRQEDSSITMEKLLEKIAEYTEKGDALRLKTKIVKTLAEKDFNVIQKGIGEEGLSEYPNYLIYEEKESGEIEYEKEDVRFRMLIPISEQPESLEDYLEYEKEGNIKSEYSRGALIKRKDGTYDLVQCQAYSEKVVFQELSEIIPVALQRFEWKSGVWGKSCKPFEMPMRCTFYDHKGNKGLYELQSFSIHEGKSIDSGHFRAYRKKGNCWHYADDNNKVSSCSEALLEIESEQKFKYANPFKSSKNPFKDFHKGQSYMYVKVDNCTQL